MKHYVLIGIILTAVLVSGCTEYSTPVSYIASFDAVSGIKNPSILNGESVQFRIKMYGQTFEPYLYLALVLPESVEYIDGDFQLTPNGEELILEPEGRPGYNAQGEYLGEDKKELIMQLNKTEYYLTVKGISEGKHTLTLNVMVDENMREWRKRDQVSLINAHFCSADTLERAVQLCTQVEPQCTTRECILERTRQYPTRSD